MDNKILPTDEYSTFENRVYINPTLGVDETNQFIDNLRNTQQVNNTEIGRQTQALGTDIASNLGGLTGAQGYWTSRYQTPQTNSAVADLRAAAQATALNEALANEKAKWQKRYNDAYNSYQKRSWDKSNNSGGSGSGGGGGATGNPTDDGEVDVNPQKTQYSYNSSVKGVENSYTFVDNAGNLHIVDMDTGEETIIPPDNVTNSGSGGAGYSGGGGGGGGGGGR